MKFKFILRHLTNLLPYIFSLYLSLIGISWIFLHIYLRFFMEKPPYSFEEFKAYIDIRHYILFIGFIMFHLLLILYNIFTLYRQKSVNKSLFTNLLRKFVCIVELLYWKPLEYINDKIAPHIPLSGIFFLHVEKIWSKKDNIYFYLLIFLFELLPRLIISLIFLIEVVIFGQIKLFIYIVSLFFVTIIWHIFLKLFANFGKRNLPIIKQYFSTIRGVGDATFDEDGNISSYSAYEFIVKPEYEDVINVEEEAKLLMQLESMQSFAEQIKKDTAKIMPYITIITSLIYLIGGVYRLIFFL